MNAIADMFTSNLLLAGGWLMFAIWAFALLPLLFNKKWYLTHHAATVPEPHEWPSVTVIVPARDEEQDIEKCLETILNIDYPHLEVIAIDDRSSDRTGEWMERVAQRDTRLKVIHIDTLPEKWLGKTHAMYRGAQVATGEYLLFTDGDIFFDPQVMKTAIRAMLAEKIEHLCLMPTMIPGSFWENAMVQYIDMVIVGQMQPHHVANPDKKTYVGFGSFNLVHSPSYWQAGGHETLRLEVLDDMKMGKLMKQSGFRQKVWHSSGMVQVRWHRTLRGFIRGLEKNAFASVGYSLPLLLFHNIFAFAVTYIPYLALSAGWPMVSGYLSALLLVHGVFGYRAHKAGVGWAITFTLPVITGIFFYTYWRSVWLTLKQGGIYWRDTFYPLALLKEYRY